MPKPSFILIPGDSIWRVGNSAGTLTDLPIPTDVTAPEIAAAVHDELRRQAYPGDGVLLAIPSHWCLAARIPLAGLPPRDRDAMLYRLEEKLPLAAEAVTADFIPDATNENALGVCIPNDRAAPLVDALEAAGVAIQSISPLALLALQASRSFDQPGRHRIAWA